jgi:putative hydrolase of the HAD superfamily
MTVVRAVLFDMGGVLVASPFAGFARYERLVGLPIGTVRRINATNPDSNAWARYERGDIDRPEFCRRFEAEARSLGLPVDAPAVLASMRGGVLDEMVTALEQVHLRWRTALLTNNLSPMDRSSPLAGRLLPHFDVVVESAVVGVRKPDPEFFRIACASLGVEPAECVFLDDLGVNCKAARQLGMHTIKVVEPLDALGELEAVLGVSLRGDGGPEGSGTSRSAPG